VFKAYDGRPNLNITEFYFIVEFTIFKRNYSTEARTIIGWE